MFDHLQMTSDLHERGLIIKRLIAAQERKHQLVKPPRKWFTIARPNQLEPVGDHNIWVILTGRGWGKSRTGAEWIVTEIEKQPGYTFGIIGPTRQDTKDTPIEAFIKALRDAGYVRGRDYKYHETELHFRFSNGTEVMGFSAEKPDRIRGKNLAGAWCDELAFFPYLDDLWNKTLAPAVRIGEHPRILVTTTPRAIPTLKRILERDDAVVVRGSTFENAANLSEVALSTLRKNYEGTRLGRQELYGELLEDAENALWTRELIEAAQWFKPLPELVRTIVSVDPSGSATGDATGICVAGVDAEQIIYVLDDFTCKGSPEKRYEHACLAAVKYEAGTILYEGAYGGDNVAHGLRSAWSHLVNMGRIDGPMPMLTVSPTKTSKQDRAHPVVALYEQTAGGQIRIRHVKALPELEDEMVQWEPPQKTQDGKKKVSWSPNRMDALVHAVRFLASKNLAPMVLRSPLGMEIPDIPIH